MEASSHERARAADEDKQDGHSALTYPDGRKLAKLIGCRFVLLFPVRLPGCFSNERARIDATTAKGMDDRKKIVTRSFTPNDYRRRTISNADVVNPRGIA